MKIRVINPNDSDAMRAMIATSCASVALPQASIETVCAGAGVASVEGFYDGALASAGVLRQIRLGEQQGCDAYLIACADDTALHPARELADGPVIGIGEAAMHTASLLGCGFSILTAQQKSVRVLERNLREYGLQDHCLGVHALQTPVLDLEQHQDPAHFDTLVSHARRVLEQDTSEVLVLGCAGLSPLQPALQQALNTPVIDGVRVGLLMLEALVRAGLKTSKKSTYAFAGTIARSSRTVSG
ncbi:MAG: aspartate/glutamate racemase family protein [Gammaproteobacteria bacterium]|nr:aspartate/glutamate racemase family protein [Gammaproteobacteria bacterium]